MRARWAAGPALSLSVHDRTLEASSDRPGVFRWLKERRTMLRTANGTRDRYTVDGSEVFVRVDFVDREGQVAFSQPVFLRR